MSTFVLVLVTAFTAAMAALNFAVGNVVVGVLCVGGATFGGLTAIICDR